MTTLFNFNFNSENSTLNIGFGAPAQNTDIVKYVEKNAPAISGVELLKINGPASLPVAFVLAHKYVHQVGAVAVFDPKLGGYVVSVSHSPKYKVGDLITE